MAKDALFPSSASSLHLPISWCHIVQQSWRQEPASSTVDKCRLRMRKLKRIMSTIWLISGRGRIQSQAWLTWELSAFRSTLNHFYFRMCAVPSAREPGLGTGTTAFPSLCPEPWFFPETISFHPWNSWKGNISPMFTNAYTEPKKWSHVPKSCVSMQVLSSCAAAAVKSLQSCPTLCDPIDGSPPGFPVPGILLARTLEWVAIAFSGTRTQCSKYDF